MAEMEDKFQEILGNEQAMSQIMSLAQSFSSGDTASDSQETSQEPGDMTQAFSQLDPKMMGFASKILSAYQSQHRSMGLMTALRPFVSQERHEMIERLATATRLAKVVTCVLEMIGDKEDSHV